MNKEIIKEQESQQEGQTFLGIEKILVENELNYSSYLEDGDLEETENSEASEEILYIHPSARKMLKFETQRFPTFRKNHNVV